jgi:hypothetical protein
MGVLAELTGSCKLSSVSGRIFKKSTVQMQSALEIGVVRSADMPRSDGKITGRIRDSKVLEKQ